MAKNSNKKKDVKEKNTFWKDFKGQLKKVVWPTPKQLFTSTSTVIVLVLVIACIVFALDFGYECMNKYGVYKLRDYVIDQVNEINTSDSQEEENSNHEDTSEEDNENGSEEHIEENENIVEDQITDVQE